MSTIVEIEAAVEALDKSQQEALLRRLRERLRQQASPRELPLVPATGNPISQRDIDDALEAD